MRDKSILGIILVLILLVFGQNVGLAWGPFTHAEIAKGIADELHLNTKETEMFVFGAVLADMNQAKPVSGNIQRMIDLLGIGGIPTGRFPFNQDINLSSARHSDRIEFARKLVETAKTYSGSKLELTSNEISAFAWGWYTHVYMDEICNWKAIYDGRESHFDNDLLVGNWVTSFEANYGAGDFSGRLEKLNRDLFVYQKNCWDRSISHDGYWWSPERVMGNISLIKDSSIGEILREAYRRTWGDDYSPYDFYAQAWYFYTGLKAGETIYYCKAHPFAFWKSVFAAFVLNAAPSGIKEILEEFRSAGPGFGSREREINYYYQTLYSVIYSIHKIKQHYNTIEPWGSIKYGLDKEFTFINFDDSWKMYNYVNYIVRKPNISEKPNWYDNALSACADLDDIP